MIMNKTSDSVIICLTYIFKIPFFHVLINIDYGHQLMILPGIAMVGIVFNLMKHFSMRGFLKERTSLSILYLAKEGLK